MTIQALKYGFFDADTKTFLPLQDTSNKQQQDSNHTSVGEFVLSALTRHGSKTLLIDYETETTYSSQQLLRDSKMIANHLYELGIRQQDVIFGYTPNTYLTVCLFVAIQLLGSIFSGIVYTSPKREVLGAVRRVESKVLACCSSNLSIAEQVVDDLDSVEFLIVVEDTFSDHQRTPGGKCIIPISDLLKECADIVTLPLKVGSEDISGILHSSGTTGIPKAIIKRQSDILQLMQHNTAPSQLVHTPIAHLSGFGAIGGTICSGELAILMSGAPGDFSIEKTLNAVQKYQLTVIMLSPSAVSLISKSPLTPKYNLTSVKAVVTGGSPISQATMENFRAATKITTIYELYGSSEVGGVTIPVLTEGFTSGGRLASWAKARIIDNKTGHYVGINEEGEILMDSEIRTPGYYKSDKQIEDDIVDGFLRTGDIGYFNEDGLIFIVGRIKEMIKVGINQVAPKSLEEILLEHEAVAEAAVAGTPDEIYGQIPRAFVVLKPGFKISEDELREYVDSQVVDYKRLEGGIMFVPSIPKISMGKIDKNKLLELYPR